MYDTGHAIAVYRYQLRDILIARYLSSQTNLFIANRTFSYTSYIATHRVETEGQNNSGNDR